MKRPPVRVASRAVLIPASRTGLGLRVCILRAPKLYVNWHTLCAADGSRKAKCPKSVRLLPHQNAYVEKLKSLEILGTKESDIVRSLIQRAIDQLNRERYIENHFKDMDLLEKRRSE
jgi:hypothetical protein